MTQQKPAAPRAVPAAQDLEIARQRVDTTAAEALVLDLKAHLAGAIALLSGIDPPAPDERRYFGLALQLLERAQGDATEASGADWCTPTREQVAQALLALDRVEASLEGAHALLRALRAYDERDPMQYAGRLLLSARRVLNQAGRQFDTAPRAEAA